MLDTAIAVRDNVDLSVVEIAATGRWTWQIRVDLMTAFRKALAQRPRAVLLDVTALEEAERTLTASLLLAEEQSAALHPPVPVVVVAREPQLWRLQASGVAGRIPVHPTRNAALSALAGSTPQFGQARVRLQPGPFAPAEARNLVGDTCLAWNFVALLHPARLIVSELATNATEHAGTPFTVTVTRRRTDLVHLAVEDGVPRLPRLRLWSMNPEAPLAQRGSGLRLVAAAATAWGSDLTIHGKVVWATLRARA
ncbi:ATP-binding protein [Dactylosporangium sp. CS-047395]|uniref:ATP-binding protein n=1 Tax=Dactylosporangium sp. CS-047395 TaxID=3239936 RepID=UPI003D8AFEC9